MFWKLFYNWYQNLPIVRKLRERRIISTFFISSLLIILVSHLVSINSITKLEKENSIINWCCSILYLLFSSLITLLFISAPIDCTYTTLTLLVSLTLLLVEFLIAGLYIDNNGAFIIRIVGYILITCLELISSTRFKEWTLFGLFLSFGIDFMSWIALIPLQQHDMNALTNVSSILHAVISAGLSFVVWTYMSSVPPISGQSVRDIDERGVENKGFRYDDAIYSLSTGWNNEIEQVGFDHDAIRNRSDGRSSLSLYLGSQPNEEDDLEIVMLKLSEPTNFYVPIVMIFLHFFVVIVAYLMGQDKLQGDVGHAILAIVLNSFICIWQICKMFGALSISSQITQVKHQRHLLKAQKDTLRTLNTLSAELKWPTSSIRGISLPSSTDKGNILQRTLRALLWAGHSTRMLEVGSEALLNSFTKFSRIISLRHVIVTFGTCLNCQSLSAVKDMHTSISVVVRHAGQPVSDNSAEVSQRSPTVAQDDSSASIAVIGNHDLLLYGLLGLHSFIIKLADPHQEIRFEIELYVDKIQGKVQLTSSITYWGERPTWSESATTRSRVIDGKGDSSRDAEIDALQTLVESIRDNLSATLVSLSQGRLCSTTFQFCLPIPGSLIAKPIESNMWKPRSIKSPWILIVDDSNVSRKLVRRNINRLIPDAEIEECSSSKSAMTSLARYGSEKFDYVLVDYVVNSEQRSIGAGVQLCTKMRQFAKHITIVGITGDNHGVALSDFLLNGADLAYMKPITPTILKEIFSMHIGQN